MVKIENEFCDKYTGKSSNAIYQKYYGTQIRRKGYNQTKPASKSQTITRQRFTDAIAWVKTLNSNEIQAIKNYFLNLKELNPRQFPINWYNFAKWLYLKKPTFKISNTSTNRYIIEHYGLMQIQEISTSGTIVYDSGSISSLEGNHFQKRFEKTPTPITSKIIVTLLTGLTHEYKIKIEHGESLYFDSRYFDSRYFA